MSQLDELLSLSFKTNRQMCLPEVQLNPTHIQKLLDINTNNIPPVPTKVNLYADHMINGQWLYNGDSIRVSKSGVLLDGQNRLMAAQKAKMNLVCDLVVGLEDKVFNTIDQGRVRQKGHLLARDVGDLKTSDAQTLSAAVTRVLKYSHELSQVTTGGKDGKLASKFSADKVIDYVNLHPEILDQLETVKTQFNSRSNLTRSAILYIYHIGCRWDEEYTLKFLKKSISGIGLQENETLFFFHQCLNEYKAKSIRWAPSELEKTLVKVWSQVADKGLHAITKKTNIKHKKGEDFMQFIAPSESALIEMKNSL